MTDTMEYIRRAHQGDKEARDALVTENMGLIWSIVRRFAGRGYDLEDLFQIGSIGLMKAIDKFDLSMDVKLSTYAVPMITGEIRRFLRDDGMIKVSRPLKELAAKTGAARERLEFSLGREPTIEELAREVGASREEVAACLLAYIRIGADVVNSKGDIPIEFITVIQGIVILMVAAEEFMGRYKKKLIYKAAEEELAAKEKAEKESAALKGKEE